jgi:hypothetical protein
MPNLRGNNANMDTQTREREEILFDLIEKTAKSVCLLISETKKVSKGIHSAQKGSIAPHFSLQHTKLLRIAPRVKCQENRARFQKVKS